MRLAKCSDCKGTGSACPDCWLCHGKSKITIRRAVKEGWNREHLEILDARWCVCPRDECRGDSCIMCDGSGRIEPSVLDAEETRVLIHGLTQRTPPRYAFYRGRWTVTTEYLSRAAAARCRDKGWITWICSVFGDEIYLTNAGEIEAQRRYGAWHAAHDACQAPWDDIGRWGDDGGFAGTEG